MKTLSDIRDMIGGKVAERFTDTHFRVFLLVMIILMGGGSANVGEKTTKMCDRLKSKGMLFTNVDYHNGIIMVDINSGEDVVKFAKALVGE